MNILCDRTFGALAVSARALATLTLILCSGCSQSPSTPSFPFGPVVVVGRVLDFSTGVGVPATGLQFGGRPLTTDADGRFTVTVTVGDYTMHVDNEPFDALVLVRGSWTRGDFLVRAGTCASRYGAILDHTTGRPIAGAKVSSATSAADGWYRVDYGCAGCGLCGTSVLSVSASGYTNRSIVLGRGVSGVLRLDVELDRQP